MQMKLNPAYLALNQKKENTTFNFEAKHKKDRQDNQYFLINLKQSNQTLSIGEVHYQEEGSPHLSYYEYYKQSKDELSVFHYTWYGKHENTRIVLHLYFDGFGKFLNYQCKNKETKNNIDNISEIEEKNIYQLYYRGGLSVTQPILQYVCQKYYVAEMKSRTLLKDLENLSPIIKQHPQKYINKAKECITAIQDQNRWTFTSPDPKGVFLQKLVIQLEQKNTPVNSLLSSGTFKYKNIMNSQEEKNTPSNTPVISSKKKKKFSSKKTNTIKPEMPENLKLQLNEINYKINIIKTPDECQTAYDIYILLKKKHDIVLNYQIDLPSDVLLNSFHAMHEQQQKIEEIFSKTIKKDNPPNSLNLLIPYISGLDISILQDIIYSGDVSLFKLYMQYHQTAALWLFNNCAFTNEKNLLNSKAFNSTVTLHQLIIFAPKCGIDFLEAALEYGLDPNFGADIHESILYQTIASRYFEHVKRLLYWGANPNPFYGKRRHALTQSHDNDLFQVKHQLLKRSIRNDFYFSSNNEGIPLQAAIYLDNLEIVELLLQKGALLNKSDQGGFDAMGWATCQKKAPNLDIVKKLIEYGADINAVQGDCSRQQGTTPLMFACQRGDDQKALQCLIEMGANPNQLVENKFMDTHSVSYAACMTPLFKLVSKHLEGRKNLDCIQYVLEQKTSPVSLLNAVLTLANVIILDQYKSLHIVRVKEKNKMSFIIGITPSSKKNDNMIHMLHQYLGNLEHVRIEQGLVIVTQANNLYKNKEYVKALPFLISGILLFGNGENPDRLQSCLFNAACCLYTLKKYQPATLFFKIASEFSPCTKTNELAKMMLKKIDNLQQNSLPQSVTGLGR